MVRSRAVALLLVGSLTMGMLVPLDAQRGRGAVAAPTLLPQPSSPAPTSLPPARAQAPVFKSAELIGQPRLPRVWDGLWCWQYATGPTIDIGMVGNVWDAPANNAYDMVAVQAIIRQAGARIETDCPGVLEMRVEGSIAGKRWKREVHKTHGWELYILSRQPESATTPAARADAARAIERLTPKARAGDAQAAYALGLLSHLGPGKHDYQAAAQWYKAAADAGSSNALYTLATLYESGQGVLVDDNMMMGLYKKAATLGHAGAMIRLATYIIVRGGNMYWDEAAPLFEKAAAAGLADAMNALGDYYRDGLNRRGPSERVLDLPYDSGRALAYYQDAVRAGNCLARINLGSMYYRGDGIPQNGQEAVKWYQSAATCAGVSAGEHRLAEIMLDRVKSAPLPAPFRKQSPLSNVAPLSAPNSPAAREVGLHEVMVAAMLSTVALVVVGRILNPSSTTAAASPTSTPYDYSHNDFQDWLSQQQMCKAIAPGMC